MSVRGRSDSINSVETHSGEDEAVKDVVQAESMITLQQRLLRREDMVETDGKSQAGSVADDQAWLRFDTYQKVQITENLDDIPAEIAKTCAMVQQALKLRNKYVYVKPKEYWGSIDRDTYESEYQTMMLSPSDPTGPTRKEPPFMAFKNPLPEPSKHIIKCVDGIYLPYEVDAEGKVAEYPCVDVRSFGEFADDYAEIIRLVYHAPFKTFAYKRLKLLEAKFDLYTILNADKETSVQKVVPHRDFYNVRKVDTHVHHSACMNLKKLLRFIKRKLKNDPDEIVIFRDGRFLSLSEVFKSLRLAAHDLSIDTLDMHADSNTFHRFDRFNLKYNPCGQSRLREIFLKTDNLIAGRFLAEVTQEVFQQLEASKYQLAEYRISIYGRQRSEWTKLARWVYVNKLASSNVRWLIQLPRLYEVYKKSGEVSNFQDLLDNVFKPLFEVTVDPSVDPSLHAFLELVVGFDCVDDESKQETSRDARVPSPAHWTRSSDPPYYYWIYYLGMNLQALNQLRAARGFSTFSFRPHCGEAGDIDHMAATFLMAESINHGITMRKVPSMQYLYYLSQIGIAMSPLSNNKLFLDYHKNPFFMYFCRGLNVSLSTDDPLLLHLTKEPLVEEYVVAAQVWKLSSTDMCEIARNSVLQSGFEHPYKAHFIGSNYWQPGPAGNDIRLTNVPNIRLQFRHDAMQEEMSLIAKCAAMCDTSPGLFPPKSALGPRPLRSYSGGAWAPSPKPAVSPIRELMRLKGSPPALDLADRQSPAGGTPNSARGGAAGAAGAPAAGAPAAGAPAAGAPAP